MTATILAAERTEIIESWYNQQDVWTKDRIDRIADSFEKGVQKRRPGKRIYFGVKSRLELCYALAHFIDKNRSHSF